MSVQFGRWNINGDPIDALYLEKVCKLLRRYGPDYEGSYLNESTGVAYCAFNTTAEAWKERQPCISPRRVLMWDGRLDNREDLIQLLEVRDGLGSTDVEIVDKAYEKWGIDCLRRLLGDWSLSIWDPLERTVILARDPIGVRPLYYYCGEGQLTWSSILDPLVLFAGKQFQLNEEYLAGWFAFFPDARLTPYTNIFSAPPGSVAQFDQRGIVKIAEYWHFDRDNVIRYRTDADYEDHFRNVFSEAVRRRIRSSHTVLAELSGGVDSSSIVCVADSLKSPRGGETPRIDTVSYFDDSEPNWNERPFFTVVEQKRGRAGLHIDLHLSDSSDFGYGDTFAVTPASPGLPNRISIELGRWIAANGNRVVLSGTGGDEVTGGVPSPTPELADLLAAMRLRSLFRQAVPWAIAKRKPVFHLFWETLRGFFPTALSASRQVTLPGWLNPEFTDRNRLALRGYARRLKVFDGRPSMQIALNTLNGLRRQLACLPLHSDPCYEKRYPYLDRDLLEFLFSIPREQVLRSKQRRSLVRRALAGIVPDEILNRRRKAFAIRAPLKSLSRDWDMLFTNRRPIAQCLGIVDPEKLLRSCHAVERGEEIMVAQLMRTFTVERWLQHVGKWGIFQGLGVSLSDERAMRCTKTTESFVPTFLQGSKSDEKGGEFNGVQETAS